MIFSKEDIFYYAIVTFIMVAGFCSTIVIVDLLPTLEHQWMQQALCIFVLLQQASMYYIIFYICFFSDKGLKIKGKGRKK